MSEPFDWDAAIAERKAIEAGARTRCARPNCDRPAAKHVRTLGYWEFVCTEHAQDALWDNGRSMDHAIDMLMGQPA